MKHDTKKAKTLRIAALLPMVALLLLTVISACSSIDCPMDNLVYTQYQLMKPSGDADTLSDTLTIYTTRHDGNDSVLINRDVAISSFTLPISYTEPADTFFFEMRDTLNKATYKDTVIVAKDNQLHFESTDCATSYFHTLTSISCTKHRIDSVRIINQNVSYETSKKHFYIYFNPNR